MVGQPSCQRLSRIRRAVAAIYTPGRTRNHACGQAQSALSSTAPFKSSKRDDGSGKTRSPNASGRAKGWDGTSTTRCLFEGTERFFRPGYNTNLVASWLPALNGVEAKLERGAKVSDVGCGLGASTIIMAQAFPNSRFYGFDFITQDRWKRRAGVPRSGDGVASRHRVRGCQSQRFSR